MKWSPDGTKVSFVQRDDTGEQGRAVLRRRLDRKVGRTGCQWQAGRVGSSHQFDLGRAQEGSGTALLASPRTTGRPTPNTCSSTRWASSGSTASTLAPRCSSRRARVMRRSQVLAQRQSGVLHPQAQHLRASCRPAITSVSSPRTAARTLLNGEVDWVYEEELYSRSNYFWSPDGKQIVFLQMNEGSADLSHHRLDPDPRDRRSGEISPARRSQSLRAPGRRRHSDGGKIKWITAKTAKRLASAGQRSQRARFRASAGSATGSLGRWC